MTPIVRYTFAAVILLTGAGAKVRAQQVSEPGPRWISWVGCWNAAPSGSAWDTNNNSAPRTVCVTPTPDLNVVDVISVADGKIVGRDRIDASGQSHQLNANGCSGTEQAKFSVDGRRVYLKSSVNCGGNQTETSALLAITGSGDWIDVRSVSAGEGSNVRVARYRDAGVPRNLPSEVTSALGERSMGASWSRVAAGAPVGASAIIEATRLVDPGVVQGWVMESGQKFAVDKETLVELADAGVPGTVTDAMVEVSNTRPVTQERNAGVYRRPYGRGASDGWDQDTGERLVVTTWPAYDPWGYYWGLGYPYGYANYGYYGRPYYGNVYGLGFGYGFGYGYASPRGYYPPVIVLHQAQGGGSRGQAVKGEGYTQPRTAQPAATSVSSNGNNSGSTAPRSGASPAPSSTAPPSSGSSRTAKARPQQ